MGRVGDMNTTSSGRAVSLDQWSRQPWTNGFQVDQLLPLETLHIRTRNSTYELTVLTPATGEVLVRGGRYFPTFTRVTLAGSSLGGGCLKVRGVYVGFLVELLNDEGLTTRTTCVQDITRAVDQRPQ